MYHLAISHHIIGRWVHPFHWHSGRTRLIGNSVNIEAKGKNIPFIFVYFISKFYSRNRWIGRRISIFKWFASSQFHIHLFCTSSDNVNDTMSSRRNMSAESRFRTLCWNVRFIDKRKCSCDFPSIEWAWIGNIKRIYENHMKFHRK